MNIKTIAAATVALSLLGGAAASAQTVDTKTQARAGLFDQGGAFDKGIAIDQGTTASISTQAPVKSSAVPADNAQNERGQALFDGQFR